MAKAQAMKYVFKLPLYQPEEEERMERRHGEPDAKLNGLTYTQAMQAAVQKRKDDCNCVQKSRSLVNVKFFQNETWYRIDPKTGKAVQFDDNKEPGQYEMKEFLKPYYEDVNYSPNPRLMDPRQIRS